MPAITVVVMVVIMSAIAVVVMVVLVPAITVVVMVVIMSAIAVVIMVMMVTVLVLEAEARLLENHSGFVNYQQFVLKILTDIYRLPYF